MIYKKFGFSLAEALMALLIVSLITAATIPVLTKKQREVGDHGKWECTLDTDGNHMVRTVINGVDSGFKKLPAGKTCSFSPPAKAENFSVKVVGGGGGGAGGLSGSNTGLINAEVGAEAVPAPFTGTYSITLLGGGGAGGAMACGDPKKYLPSLSFKSYGSGTETDPGGYDAAVGTSVFDYTKIYANDSSKYSPYVTTPGDYCFAEKDWKLGEFDKCWNFPGQGGGAGSVNTFTQKFNKGDLITLTQGDGGKTDGEGGPGNPGENSCMSAPGMSAAKCASGGSGGYNRHLVTITYKNIPVDYYEGYWTTDVCWNPKCVGGNVPDDPNCEGDSCTSHYDSCATTVREYYGCVQYKAPVRKIRSDYFSVTACTSSSNLRGTGGGVNADKADDINTNSDGDPGPGSGGLGAGQTTVEEDVAGLTEEDGQPDFYTGRDGFGGTARAQYVTFAAGSGGSAGNYIYSLFKKLPKIDNISIGVGGGAAGANSDGQRGGETKFGDMLKASGGNGGRKSAIFPAAGAPYAIGGEGAPSPLDTAIKKDLLIPLGGYQGSNTAPTGQSVFTSVYKGRASDPWFQLLAALGLVPHIGGKKSDYTYGAGGGGGGGGNGVWGYGGAGAPGAVIIEW